MDSLVVFDTEDSNYLDRQPMVKMASKESSPPPPSFLGFAVHQSIKFSEILFSPSNSYSAFAFYKNSATFFNPMKNKHPNLYSKTPN